jgi:uncharacterized membrane protein
VYDPVVPRWLPGAARSWTYASGVAELVVAALLAVPRTRRAGGWAAALLLLAVYPANVQMTVDAERRRRADPGNPRTRSVLVATVFRLPLQVPLVASSVAVGLGRDDPGT